MNEHDDAKLRDEFNDDIHDQVGDDIPMDGQDNIPPFDASDVYSEDEAMGRARPIPRISIQSFCESPRTAEVMQVAAEDRRLAKTHFSVHMGGAAAAVAHYQESPTPNLIIVESTLPRGEMLGELDALAECCDAGTKVIVIGHANDVLLYRELLKRGVSEYQVAPISPIQLMESISNLYNDPESDPVGNVMAFIGAKGGVGSSTICHNVGWTLSDALRSDVVIADLDLAFGTTGLDFNQDPVQGIADALSSPERLDEVLLDRLLTKCSEHLSIFAAPVILDRDYDLSADACDMVIDVVRQNVPYVLVDLPHTWTTWTKRLMLGRRRGRHHGNAGSRQPAQRQEHHRPDATDALERRAAAPGDQYGGHCQAAGDSRSRNSASTSIWRPWRSSSSILRFSRQHPRTAR